MFSNHRSIEVHRKGRNQFRIPEEFVKIDDILNFIELLGNLSQNNDDLFVNETSDKIP